MSSNLEAERDEAIALFERAQAALGAVEPEALRKPLWWFFAAKVEMCRAHRSVLGLPVNYAMDMARAIVATRPSRIQCAEEGL